MPIALDCHCGKRLQVGDGLQGKRVRCPVCREVIVVPASQPAGRTAAGDTSRSDSSGGYDLQALAAMERTAEADWEVACPECDNRLRVSSSQAGQSARCPVCFSLVAVPETQPTASAAVATDTDVAPPWEHVSVAPQSYVSKKSLAPGWETARSGLNLVYLGGVVYWLTLLGMIGTLIPFAIFVALVLLRASAGAGMPNPVVLIGLATMVYGAISAGVLWIVLQTAEEYFRPVLYFIVYTGLGTILIVATDGGAAQVMFGAGFVAMLLASVILLVGWCMCCAIPRESKVKFLAVASATCLLAAIVCYVAAIVVALANRPRAALDVDAFGNLLIAFYACAVAAHFLFVFFLRGIPRFFNHRQAVERTNRYLIYTACVAAAGFLFTFLAQSSLTKQTTGSGTGGALLSFVFLVLAVIGVVWFLRLVSSARDDIRPYFRA